MTRSDVTLCSWNSPAPLVGNTISRFVYVKQSGWLENLWTDAGTCLHCTNTCPRYQPRCDQRLEAAPHWRMGKHITKRHRQSSWSMEKSSYMQAWRQMASLWTYATLKPALFRANTLHNLFFSQPLTVYWGKHVVSRHFHRSHLKANKVNKG